MRKAKQILLTLVLLAASTVSFGQTTEPYDWTDIMEAIIKVESSGNPRAFNPKNNCAGILQITPILVKDCNQILSRRKSKVRYTLQDRYNVEKSKEMFVLWQETYNPQHDLERAIRLWNGGPGFAKRSTEAYYQKVIKHYKPKEVTESYDTQPNEDQ
jgi:hypothetical protein